MHMQGLRCQGCTSGMPLSVKHQQDVEHGLYVGDMLPLPWYEV